VASRQIQRQTNLDNGRGIGRGHGDDLDGSVYLRDRPLGSGVCRSHQGSVVLALVAAAAIVTTAQRLSGRRGKLSTS